MCRRGDGRLDHRKNPLGSCTGGIGARRWVSRDASPLRVGRSGPEKIGPSRIGVRCVPLMWRISKSYQFVSATALPRYCPVVRAEAGIDLRFWLVQTKLGRRFRPAACTNGFGRGSVLCASEDSTRSNGFGRGSDLCASKDSTRAHEESRRRTETLDRRIVHRGAAAPESPTRGTRSPSRSFLIII